jgi:hypothetical protein
MIIDTNFSCTCDEDEHEEISCPDGMVNQTLDGKIADRVDEVAA